MCYGDTKDVANTLNLIDESRIIYIKQLKNSLSLCVQSQMLSEFRDKLMIFLKMCSSF